MWDGKRYEYKATPTAFETLCFLGPKNYPSLLYYFARLAMSTCVPRRGFMKLLQLVLKTRADGLIHCGPPCSTWVWVNRATSRRSRDVPQGDLSVPSVSSSNTFLGFYIVGIKHESMFIEFYWTWTVLSGNLESNKSEFDFQVSKIHQASSHLCVYPTWKFKNRFVPNLKGDFD